MTILTETIAPRDMEVKRLSALLQTQEALQQTLLNQTTADLVQGLKVEELQKLTAEVSELRTRLYKAEDDQQKAQLQMDTAQLKHELLQEHLMTWPDEVTPGYHFTSLIVRPFPLQ